MHLVQIYLPLYDNEGRRFGPEPYDRLKSHLTATFGGVTAYRRAPAEGMWKEGDGGVTRDEVVVFEVVSQELDRAWWKEYKQGLEEAFSQKEILMIASEIDVL